MRWPDPTPRILPPHCNPPLRGGGDLQRGGTGQTPVGNAPPVKGGEDGTICPSVCGRVGVDRLTAAEATRPHSAIWSASEIDLRFKATLQPRHAPA